MERVAHAVGTQMIDDIGFCEKADKVRLLPSRQFLVPNPKNI